MKRRNYTLALFLIFMIVNTVNGQHKTGITESQITSTQKAFLNLQFKEYQVINLKTDQIFRYASKQPGTFQLSLNLEHHFNWTIQLILNDLRGDNYQEIFITDNGPVVQPTQAPTTYKGFLNGNKDNEVRLTIKTDNINGFIKSDDQWYFIEPLTSLARDKGFQNDQYLLYNIDNRQPGNELTCGIDEIKKYVKEQTAIPLQNNKNGSVAPKCMDVASEADYRYYQLHGGGTCSRITSIVNQVEGMYGPLTVSINFTCQYVWTTNNDPYNSTSIADVFFAFRGRWNAVYPSTTRDVGLLFSGRQLSHHGVAYGSVMCHSPTNSYTVGIGVNKNSGAILSTFQEAKIQAHEIGHNLWGTSHITSSNNLMHPNQPYNSGSSFTSATISVMESYIASYPGCLSCAPACQYSHVINYPLYNTISYPASSHVVATSSLQTGTTVNFYGGSYVLMDPGFDAPNGTEFMAYINNCSTPVTGNTNGTSSVKKVQQPIADTPTDLCRMLDDMLLQQYNKSQLVTIAVYKSDGNPACSSFTNESYDCAMLVSLFAKLPKISYQIYITDDEKRNIITLK